MKNLFILGLLLVAAKIIAQVPSKVEAVTVYQTRAEITRSATKQLIAGEHELVFSGVSSFIDQNNIQVKGTGNLTILGISFQQNYLNEKELPEDLQKVKDEIDGIDLEIQKLINHRESLEAEKAMLLANQKIGGEQQTLKREDLEAVTSYFQLRLRKLADDRLDVIQEIKLKSNELKKLRAHYADRTSQFRRNSGEIVVNVEAMSSTKANLSLTYMVSKAGWRAEYDLRAEDIGAPLQLNYKAIVTQNTGENWKDVKLTLSTGNPTASITKPTMNPQYLDYYYSNNFKLEDSGFYGNRMEATGAVSRAAPPLMAEELNEEPEFDDLEVETETKTLFTNYEIERPYSLNSGEKPLTVTVRDQEVDADYEYQAVPKLRNRVFLIAKAKNWGSLVLLPGPMNIFFEGGYVGKSYMNPQTTASELPISLGYDPGITIKRKLLTDVSSKKTIGANRRETYTYEIAIRNNKKQEISVKIQDQIPVSKNTDIKVEVLDLGGAKHNLVTGEITWELKLNSAQEIKKRFGFEVKYPKNETISGL